MRWRAEAMLHALARAPYGLLRRELREAAGVDDSNADCSLRALLRRGLARRVRRGCYRITRAGRRLMTQGGAVRSTPARAKARVTSGTLRERMWRAMRIARRFSRDEVLQLACDGRERDPVGSYKRYRRALQQAGYLSRIGAGRGRTHRWLLVRDTGPRAPVWRRSRGAVYDPNTGEEHPCGATG